MSVVALSGKEAIVGQGGEDFAKDYEDKHVHKVYEVIAPHFSATRFKVNHGILELDQIF